RASGADRPAHGHGHRRDPLRAPGRRDRRDRGLGPAGRRRDRPGREHGARHSEPLPQRAVSAPRDGPPERPDRRAGRPDRIATGSALADISIRNHVFAWMLMFGLIGFGLICFTGAGSVVKGLGVSQNPDVDFPIINVSVTYEGASPEIMETDVVDFTEDAVTSVDGVQT